MKNEEKIGIITILDNTNYGNRLQNYAMQSVLEEYGFHAETIQYSKYTRSQIVISEMKNKLLNIRWIIKIRNMVKAEKYTADCNENRIKTQKISTFKMFNKKYINFSQKKIFENHFSEKFIKGFIYFIVGSDQIWNPTYQHFDKYITYLRFAPLQKRIAIAPSFGVKEIPINQKKEIAQYLREMAYISVREKSGQKIVKDLTGEVCDVLLDPTLLADPKIWKKMIEETETQFPKRYLLTYFLGDLADDRRRYIYQYAKKNNLQIVEMNSLKAQEYYTWGPESFIKAIYNSEMFFTDSFHGSVFAILFHKQFGVFRRKDKQADMFDRIETLLSTFNFNEQEISDLEQDLNVIEDSKFEIADQILELKRKCTKEKIISILNKE